MKYPFDIASIILKGSSVVQDSLMAIAIMHSSGHGEWSHTEMVYKIFWGVISMSSIGRCKLRRQNVWKNPEATYSSLSDMSFQPKFSVVMQQHHL